MMIDNAPEMAIETEVAPDVYFPTLTCNDLRNMQVRSLLLTGELSPRMFHYITEELARCLPWVERATIPKASHAMHVGNPQVYSETVLDFLGRY